VNEDELLARLAATLDANNNVAPAVRERMIEGMRWMLAKTGQRDLFNRLEVLSLMSDAMMWQMQQDMSFLGTVGDAVGRVIEHAEASTLIFFADSNQ
jgi:hypothetical protein